MNRKFIIEALKYGVVGVFNTLLTALVIWIMLRFVFGIKNETEASSLEMSVSNICGYTVGLINSFILNRNWTFKNQDSWKKGFLKFFFAFGVCYLIQLGVVLCLNKSDLIPFLRFDFMQKEYIVTSAYLCQLIGIVVYTSINFFCNKFYTFRVKNEELPTN